MKTTTQIAIAKLNKRGVQKFNQDKFTVMLGKEINMEVDIHGQRVKFLDDETEYLCSQKQISPKTCVGVAINDYEMAIYKYEPYGENAEIQLYEIFH